MSDEVQGSLFVHLIKVQPLRLKIHSFEMKQKLTAKNKRMFFFPAISKYIEVKSLNFQLNAILSNSVLLNRQ